MKKVSFLMSHPIQYYSPLFEYLTAENTVDLKVYYCSDYGVSGKIKHHPQLGEMKTYDVDLLKGYYYTFLKNYSFYSSIFKGFFGAVNLGLFRYLKKDRPDLLIVYGWNYFTMVYGVICCRLLGIEIALRGDNSIETDSHIQGVKLSLKKAILGGILFRAVDYVLYVGESNRDFYLKYKTAINKLWFMPHAVNNQFFHDQYIKLSDQNVKDDRSERKLHVLFVGRLVPQKRPLELIQAVEGIDDVTLTIVGMGPLTDSLNEYLIQKKINNINLVGFKNQTELPLYFSDSDVFVLPSGRGETWGLVVNEAMNFGLPVIVSDTTGCARDLVDGNGFVFKTGDIIQLREKIILMRDDAPGRIRMSKRSLEIIDKYSYRTVSEQLQKILVK